MIEHWQGFAMAGLVILILAGLWLILEASGNNKPPR